MTDFLREIEGHIPALRKYARALTRNADLADDLVQDCLERAIRKRHLWRTTGTLKGWLYRILLNIFRNDRKRQQLRQTWPLDDLVVEPSVPAPQTAHLALAEVAKAMDALPDEQREALLLVVLEGFSYAEAAKILGIPAGTLMSRLSRARSKLKELTGEAREPRLRTVT
jgi:RNA polymerase sigma-70 factor, ECF subfamily